MAVLATVTQQPRDVQDYDIDFGDWFPLDDTIVQAVVSASPAMPKAPTCALAPAPSRVVKVWVYAGGLDGAIYQITLRAITADGREKEVELRVKIKEF